MRSTAICRIGAEEDRPLDRVDQLSLWTVIHTSQGRSQEMSAFNMKTMVPVGRSCSCTSRSVDMETLFAELGDLGRLPALLLRRHAIPAISRIHSSSAVMSISSPNLITATAMSAASSTLRVALSIRYVIALAGERPRDIRFRLRLLHP